MERIHNEWRKREDKKETLIMLEKRIYLKIIGKNIQLITVRTIQPPTAHPTATYKFGLFKRSNKNQQ
jgi:hypothetical protein